MLSPLPFSAIRKSVQATQNLFSTSEGVCYPVAMIQRWAWLIFLCLSALGASAASYELVGGATLTGEPISANAQGLVVKREDGSFAPRTAWTNFTQNALKQLSQNAKAKPFVDPLLETEEEITARKTAQDITLKQVPRLPRPDLHSGFAGFFRSPLSLTLLILVYAANIYAGFEIALFRNYPIAAVCAAAAVLPVIGPVVFLCLPRYVPRVHQPAEEQLAEEHQEEHVVATEQVVEAAPAAAAQSANPGLPPPTVYQRGAFSFNRRFFETKMPGFLRMVPSDAEKDMVILVKSSRGEYLASRIAKLTPNEVCFHVSKGNASQDVMIPYTELAEVQVRHKDLQ